MTGRPWFRDWFGGEEANSFALLLVMLPMLLTAFGLGVDMTHNQYIRQELQSAADMATVAGSAVTTIDPTTRNSNISAEGALEATRQVYQANRDAGPATLDCLGSEGRCWVEYKEPTISKDKQSIDFYALEQTRNGFLSIVGIPTQQYHIVSKARVNQTTE